MTNYIDIPVQLPSLNEYINACRSHWTTGRKFKANIENVICAYISKAITEGKCRKVTRPCEICIIWRERTKKRDADNIESGAKFILDAMKRCGVIKDDSRRYVRQVYHRIEDADKDGSRVIIKEADSV